MFNREKEYIITFIFFMILSIVFIFIKTSQSGRLNPVDFEEEYFHITDEVSAKHAIIFDATNNKKLAGKNETIPTSIASITKLYTGVIASKYLDENDIITIKREDISVYEQNDLRIGDSFQAPELLNYSLIKSSNTGINGIGRLIKEKTGKDLIELATEYAKENRLVQTHFLNPSGLDQHDRLSGSESSAIEIALFASAILKNEKEFAKNTVKEEETFYSTKGRKYIAKNTNILISATADNKPIISKTGFTNIAGGGLIMGFEIDGKNIIMVVLNSSKQGRFSDMRVLIDLYKKISI